MEGNANTTIYTKYIHILMIRFTYLRRWHLGNIGAWREDYNYKKTCCSPTGSRKTISGWYSMYPAPNGIACHFRFDWTSGFAQIWCSNESICSHQTKNILPGQVWNVDNFREQQLLLHNLSDIFPSQNGYQIPCRTWLIHVSIFL